MAVACLATVLPHVGEAAASGMSSLATSRPDLSFTTQPTDIVAGTLLPVAVRLIVPPATPSTTSSTTTTSTTAPPVSLSSTSLPSVTLTITPGTGAPGAVLSGTTTLPMTQVTVYLDGEGGTWTAGFDDLAITSAHPGYTLTATATLPDGSLLSAISTPFDVAPGAPAQLRFLSAPVDTRAGDLVEPPVQVQIQDRFANPVTDRTSAVPVTVTLYAGTAEAALRGSTTVVATGGIATFDTLRIDTPGNDYRLRADAPDLSGTSSATFRILSARTARLVFEVAPAGSVAGAVIRPAVLVTLVDQAGIRLDDRVATVTLSLDADNGATLGGTTIATTVRGRAAFDGLRVDRPGHGYRLVAATTGLASATSEPFDVRATPAGPRGGVPWWPFLVAAGVVALLALVLALRRGGGDHRRIPPGPPPHAVPHADAGTAELTPLGRGPVRTIDVRVEPHADAGPAHAGDQP